MSRREYAHDPNAPTPNSIVVAASAVVGDEHGRILLHRRSDNRQWSIPGGAMEVGETIAQTVVREVREETGLTVAVDRLVGIYSDPAYVVEYSDGEVRQQFSICFACTVIGGELAVSDETLQVEFFPPSEMEELPIGEAIRLRIDHYLDQRDQPVIA